MKFNKFLFLLGLRPLTADIIRDEYQIMTRKHMKKLFEDTVVPELIRYGTYSSRPGRLGHTPDEVKILKDIFSTAELPYETNTDQYGTYFSISLK